MRKVDTKQFILFRLESTRFSYNGYSFEAMLKAFKEFNSKCTLYGIREDGTRAILDQK